MLKILLIPSAEKQACFWCENKKKLTITTEFSNGFMRGKPLCFDCLERAVRVQTASEAIVRSSRVSLLQRVQLPIYRRAQPPLKASLVKSLPIRRCVFLY